jgi:hypothetical protein
VSPVPEPRRAAGVLAAGFAPLALVLAGCGEDEVAPKPELPSETPALWNPCDGLEADFVNRQFKATTEKNAGTPTKPDCRFVPTQGTDEPVVSVNYQQFAGSLAEFWQAMGQPEDADVRTPTVPGADGARIVVATEKDQLYVTGFVQNGFLFEVVNVVDPAPYDEKRVVRATEAVLEQLTAHADREGAGVPPSSTASVDPP